MTKDDIKRWAMEAGFNRLISIHPKTGVHKTEAYGPDSLERFAALVAADERAARIAAQTENEALKAERARSGLAHRRATLDAVREAVLAEREACARLCDGMVAEISEIASYANGDERIQGRLHARSRAARLLSSLIRERGAA